MEVSFQFSGLFGLSKTLGQTNEFNELSPTQKAPFWHLNFPKSRRAGQQTLSSSLYTNVTECLERGALQRTPTDKFVQSVAPLGYCLPILKQFLFHSPTHSLTTKVEECDHIFTNISHMHSKRPAESQPGRALSLSPPFLFPPTLHLYLHLCCIVLFFIFAVSVLAERGGEREIKRREAQDRKREGWREQGLKHLLFDVWCFNESISLRDSKEEKTSVKTSSSQWDTPNWSA